MELKQANVEQRLQVLQHQNQRLAVQLDEKRKATRALEDKVSEYERKEQEYAQTLMCVNRIWEQLNTELRHLASVAVAECPTPTKADPPEILSSLASVQDPFLRQLLLPYDAAAAKPVLEVQKKLQPELTEVETALHERASSTKAILASLLDALRSLKASQNSLSEQLRRGAADKALAQDHSRLVTEAGSLRNELSAARAAQLAAMEAARVAQDRNTEAAERTRQLQNELADAEQELANLQRKFNQLKNTQATAQKAGPDAGTAGATGAANGAGGSGDGVAAPAGLGRQNSLVALPSGDYANAVNTSADELAELQALLAKRTADLNKERESVARLQRELHDAVQARAGDETWVASTRTYGALQVHAAQLSEALAARGREAEGLARERDEALREAQARAAAQASEAAMRSKLAALEKAHRELQFAKAESDRRRGEAEAELAKERERGGAGRTAGELRAMVATLQGQVTTLQQKLKLSKVAQERVDSAAVRVEEAAARVTAAELRAERLADTLRRREVEVEEATRQAAADRDRLRDMQAFVEVLTTYCADMRDMVEVRTSEAALRAQVAALQAQLQGHELQAKLKEALAAAAEARAQTELSALECDGLRAEVAAAVRRCAELQEQLGHSKAECELYINELESYSQAYEDMQDQNKRLLELLAGKDEAHAAVVAEKLKVSQQVSQVQEQLASARADAERVRAEAAEQVPVREALERETARLAVELAHVREQLRAVTSRADTSGQEAKRLEAQVSALSAQAEAAQRAVEASKAALEEAGEKAGKERVKRQRLEDEVKALQGKVEKMKKTSTPAGATRELQEEIDAMRMLLNCNVCHERQKNVIITKCCHVFCERCIKKNLEARNRKCPGCGVTFAQGDVKQFFFT